MKGTRAMATEQPNILIIMTDQLRPPTVYESDELRRFRREKLTAETGLRDSGVSFERHYAMSAACAPSRAASVAKSLLPKRVCAIRASRSNVITPCRRPAPPAAHPL